MDSNLEVYIDSNHIYLPLLFDPAIEAEIHARQSYKTSTNRDGPLKTKNVIVIRGRYFVKTLSVNSLLDNFEKIHPDSYQGLRNTFIKDHYLTSNLESIAVDGKLRVIINSVMPYFIKKNNGVYKQSLDEAKILDLLEEKINIPSKYYAAAKALTDVKPLRNILNSLKNIDYSLEPLKGGLLPCGELRDWCRHMLLVKLFEKEQKQLKQAIQMRKNFNQTKQEHIAVLLYLTETGSLEIDGFGFMKIDGRNDYWVYKRTGAYILTDYYARSYRFPDCRVAVSTSAAMKPFVIDTYKHPFLKGHAAEQEICLRQFNPPTQFTAKNIIHALEEGITVLLYGYDPRRRNGYHSLDRTRQYVRTIEFDDYRI